MSCASPSSAVRSRSLRRRPSARSLILPRMPRSNSLFRGAIVAAVAFSVLACAGRPAYVPAPPALYPGPTPVVPSVDPGRPYAEALVAALASDPLVLHAVQTTKAKAAYGMDSVKLDTTMTVDLSDRDHHMRVVSKSPAGKTVKTESIVVGKSAFSRIGGAKWTKSLRTDFERTRTDIVRALQIVRNASLLRLRRPRDRRQAKAPSPHRCPGPPVRLGDRDDRHVRPDSISGSRKTARRCSSRASLSGRSTTGSRSPGRPRCASRNSAGRSRSWHPRTSVNGGRRWRHLPIRGRMSGMASRKRQPFRSLIVVLVVARPRRCVARPAQADGGSVGGEHGDERRPRTCQPGPAASTSTARERSRPRSRGCGARRRASRSCATSSTGRPTTARPTSVATSTGCAATTATTSRCRRASIRPVGPPACAISSTIATGSSPAGPSIQRCDPPSSGCA